MNKGRNRDNYCLECNSKLIVVGNSYKCSGEKLKILENLCMEYEAMSSVEKNKFLKSVPDTNEFEKLYHKWKYHSLACDNSNHFHRMNNDKVLIADPVQVSRLERELKRNLTPEELSGEKSVKDSKGVYIILNKVVFPDDV